MRRGLALLFSLFTFILGCRAQEDPALDTVLPKLYYPELAYIQYYHGSAIQPFYKKWMEDSLITIAHFGDSHVQPDIYTGEFRRRLQEQKGYAGLGMIFPYAAAGTYSTSTYSSSYTGKWLYAKSIEYKPKLPLGISGATIRTNDGEASFTINFKDTQRADYRMLRIYCKQSPSSFDMIVKTDGDEIPVEVDSMLDEPYIEVQLPQPVSFITVQLIKRHPWETEFEFYGTSLESVHPRGVILHNLGIGGAQFRAPMEQEHLPEQLVCIKSDLVILDYGTNDFLYKNAVPEDMEQQIKDVILRIRQCDPSVTILLTTSQDMCWHNMCVTAGNDFSRLIHKIAREENCPFFDWYWLTKGPGNSFTWQELGYMRPDGIHLTEKGYKLKGELLANAFTNTMQELWRGTHKDSLILNIDSLTASGQVTIDSLAKVMPPPKPPVKKTGSGKYKYHKVKPGETLGGIASKYHVSVDAIKKANGMRNNKIVVGKMLKIPVKR
jgi:LysM repeat protein/lysophospholipase L1-like esterase